LRDQELERHVQALQVWAVHGLSIESAPSEYKGPIVIGEVAKMTKPSVGALSQTDKPTASGAPNKIEATKIRATARITVSASQSRSRTADESTR
jgi:hypothetical protein